MKFVFRDPPLELVLVSPSGRPRTRTDPFKTHLHSQSIMVTRASMMTTIDEKQLSIFLLLAAMEHGLGDCVLYDLESQLTCTSICCLDSTRSNKIKVPFVKSADWDRG